MLLQNTLRPLSTGLLAALSAAAAHFFVIADADVGVKLTVEPLREFVALWCTECHGGTQPKGKLDLARFTADEDFLEDPELLLDLRAVIALGEMPPEEAEFKPDAAQRTIAAEAISVLLTAAESAAAGDPGELVLRRLTKLQYRNTIRDLLGVEATTASELPADVPAEGFDGLGDGQWFSPLLLEGYADVTDAVLDALYATPVALASLLTPAAAAEDRDAARTVLANFLPRAFRGSVSDTELDGRLALWDRARERGASFAEALRPALAASLLAPRFLFRTEAVDGDSGAVSAWRLLDDHELAVRLSYGIWCTMPDAELFRAAAAGELVNRSGREQQIRRMLADPRSRALADDFFSQWLGYRSLRDSAVDIRKYAAFYQRNLITPMYEEAALNCAALVREDRSILLLLDATTSFLNARLAEHYGIAGVEGAQMREVALPDRRRGGAVGWGAVLTITSHPLRTSPVLRGRWVLESLLAAAPDPPPPNAGVLPEEEKQDDGLTLRARLERHRADTACAGCHAAMDPLGFALENFDGIGAWREADPSGPVDASGMLPDGTRLDGVEGLKDALLARRESFARAAAERLFVYLVGRPAGPADRALLDRAAAHCLEEDGRFSALLTGIVESAPFLRIRSVR